jgi:uncharacterized protein
MTEFVAILSGLFEQPLFYAVAALAALCGVVRGFAGFGAGMIFMPAMAAFYEPAIAVIALWIMDSLPSLPIVLPALKHAQWRTVLPVVIGYAIAVNLGVALLTSTDPAVLRWLLSLTVFVFVAVLWSRWTYKGPRPQWLSALVGGIAGIFGGAAQIPAPPILAYWMAGNAPPVTVRANMIAFFALSSLLSGVAFIAAGVFTQQAVAIGVAVSPVYLAGLLAGARFFRSASDRFYRRVAFIIILTSAVAGLPLFDALWN